MGTLSQDKYKPTIFVGLGGNGGKVVNIIARKLGRHPNWKNVEPLVHFLAIDTNKDDIDKHQSIRPDCRFLVSSFNARTYVERKRGEQELQADPMVTQWIPTDYGFRDTQGAGAGQIRIESRLRLYYNLEEDRAGIRRKIRDLLEQAVRRDNPYRDNEDKVVRVVIIGSVAGGTGSGGFLPMAYLLRSMVDEAGWGRPDITAYLSLPTTFLNKVKPQLHADIMANGYAALKELEFLTRRLGYEQGGERRVEFHFDPGTRVERRKFAQGRPFTIAYLVDRPDQVSIEQYEAALADAAFLQMFSGILGEQQGEYDNYEKSQKKLALGHYTVHYGALGVAYLQLPRNDILRYSSMRYTARAFRDFLCFGSKDSAINYSDKAFQKLSEDEKAQKIDKAFRDYIAEQVAEETRRAERGVFTAIQAQVSDQIPLQDILNQKLQAIYDELSQALAELKAFDPMSIQKGMTSVKPLQAQLRKDIADIEGRIMSEEVLGKHLSRFRSGRFFSDFFGDYKVNPLAQRLFLLNLLQRRLPAPTQELEEILAVTDSFSIDDSGSQATVAECDKALLAATQGNAIGRLFDRDDERFKRAKQSALSKLNGLRDQAQAAIERKFWQRLVGPGQTDSLLTKAKDIAAAFRDLARESDKAAADLEARADRFLKNPETDAESDVAQFYLEAEVLKDDRRKVRLWDWLYSHLLENDAWEPAKIFEAVTKSFEPVQGRDGVKRIPGSKDICATIQSTLMRSSTDAFRKALAPKEEQDSNDDPHKEDRLNLLRGLELEARYIAVLDSRLTLEELQRSGQLNKAVEEVPEETVREGLQDRMRRLGEQCVLLAHVDPSKSDDPDVKQANIALAGLAREFESTLGRTLSTVQVSTTNMKFLDNWQDRDSMVLYRAALGVPLYFFKNLTELQASYRMVRDRTDRGYPLHIEASWEKTLPDLDPEEMKAFDEKTRREAEEQRRRAAELGAAREFSLASIYGSVVGSTDGMWEWVQADVRGKLGPTRSSAYAAFQALDALMRQDLLAGPLETWMAAVNGERPAKDAAKAEVQAHDKKLAGLYAKASAEGRTAERLHLALEREAVAALYKELEK